METGENMETPHRKGAQVEPGDQTQDLLALKGDSANHITTVPPLRAIETITTFLI